MRPLPYDFRDHLSELSGNELKVWLHYYLLTGDALTSHPSNLNIEVCTGLSHNTIDMSKARLKAKGWMRYTGNGKQPRRAGGTFDVPIMELRLPWRPDWIETVQVVSEVYQALTAAPQNLGNGDVECVFSTAPQILGTEGTSSGSGSGSGSISSSKYSQRYLKF